jgi:chromosome transmission fidelity protein 1
LICSTLTWLRHHKQGRCETSHLASVEEMKGEPDWIVEQALQRKRDELIRDWEDREKRLETIRIKERQMEERVLKRQRRDELTSRGGLREVDEEGDFLIDDWSENPDDVREKDPYSDLSGEMRAMLRRIGIGGGCLADGEDGELEEDVKAGVTLALALNSAVANCLQIYYTSRTHSQLTQFISELRRPSFPPSIPAEILASKRIKGGAAKVETVKQLPLSSRQRLCINPAVARLGSISAINDRCAELQQAKSTKKCQFMPGADNLKQMHEFRDTAMATIPDIEDLYQKGKQLNICPYYASRSAIPSAEVVTLPYPLLLQESARDALGIKLEGNIVIIDEAHNIMDAIANVHSAEISLVQLKRARQMLGVYVKRFGKKLKGANRVMVAQLVRVIDSLAEWLDTACSSAGKVRELNPLPRMTSW